MHTQETADKLGTFSEICTRPEVIGGIAILRGGPVGR
ncbi:hypothetical protein KvSKV_07860 [Ketogulonicigenium vulgare]|nr:hypothetical protein KvSKV_07860 [Ketogulonicigenium vulgare]